MRVLSVLRGAERMHGFPNLLQLKMFDTFNAGEEFFTTLETLGREPAATGIYLKYIFSVFHLDLKGSTSCSHLKTSAE
jgi:type VI protein secretion system component VasF